MLWGNDEGADIGTIIGAQTWSEAELDEAIEEAEAEGYPPETIEALKEHRDEMIEYQTVNDIQPLTDDPDVDPSDVGGENVVSNVGNALNDPNVSVTSALPNGVLLLVAVVGLGGALWLLRPVLTVGAEVVA